MITGIKIISYAILTMSIGLCLNCTKEREVLIEKNKIYQCKIDSLEIDDSKHKLKKWKLVATIEKHKIVIYIHSPSRDLMTSEDEITGKCFFLEFLDEITNPYFGNIRIHHSPTSLRAVNLKSTLDSAFNADIIRRTCGISVRA
jgi:hypothetical protein